VFVLINAQVLSKFSEQLLNSNLIMFCLFFFKLLYRVLYPETLRCITRKHCQLLSRVVHHDRCLAECPSGYKQIENIDANVIIKK